MKDEVYKNLSKHHSTRFGEIAVEMVLVVINWFEDRPSYSETVNTHDYGTKVLLINRLHNR